MNIKRGINKWIKEIFKKSITEKECLQKGKKENTELEARFWLDTPRTPQALSLVD